MKATITSVPDRIMKRARSAGRGGVFTPSDFLDVAGRAAVDQALSRLVKSGALRRLTRGLYDYPRSIRNSASSRPRPMTSHRH